MVDWLITKLQSRQDRVWLVLDGFQHPLVPAETHDFIQLFATRFLDRLPLARLIILGYARPLDELGPALESEKLEYINLDHLQQFFEWVIQRLQISEFNAAEKIFVEFKSQVPARDEDRMVFLGNSLPRIVRKLRSATRSALP